MTEPMARTVKDFCATYGICERSAYNLMDAGVLTWKKMGKRTLITEESARAWFDSLPTFGRTHVSVGTNVHTHVGPIQEGAGKRKMVLVKGKGLE